MNLLLLPNSFYLINLIGFLILNPIGYISVSLPLTGLTAVVALIEFNHFPICTIRACGIPHILGIALKSANYTSFPILYPAFQSICSSGRGVAS